MNINVKATCTNALALIHLSWKQPYKYKGLRYDLSSQFDWDCEDEEEERRGVWQHSRPGHQHGAN